MKPYKSSSHRCAFPLVVLTLLEKSYFTENVHKCRKKKIKKKS
jgi:hypothetical protein